MSGTLRFRVRSSSGDGLYDVVAIVTGGGLRISCTCPAGENGQHCKHRIALIEGDGKALAPNSDTLPALKALLAGSPILPALAELRRAEREAESLKRQVAAAKTALARAMMGE